MRPSQRPPCRPLLGDQDAGGRRHSTDGRERLGLHVVEDEVVALRGAGEVGPRVVDDVVGTERADQVDVAGAAHTRHLGAESLGDLHGECADAAGRARDQHRLARLDVRDVAQRLQCRHGRRGAPLPACTTDTPDGQPARGWPHGTQAYSRQRSSSAPPEHLVAGAEGGDILPDTLPPLRQQDPAQGTVAFRPRRNPNTRRSMYGSPGR